LFFQFLFVHKSHCSSHSIVPFQHVVFVEILVVHRFVQLLFVLQFALHSSHSSQGSFVLFQHFEVVILHSKEHFQSYQLLVQLSHCSHVSFIQFQQDAEHLSHKSIGHVAQVSHESITQFQQFGFHESYVVHFNVHKLESFQLLVHLSHCSYSSCFQSQHLWFLSTILQYLEHLPSCQFNFQLSHSSQGSLVQLPHELVQLPISVGQLLQFSPGSTFLFQQFFVAFLHSIVQLLFSQFCSQLSQSSQTSLIQFQQLVVHFSPKSIGQVIHVSPGSITQFQQLGFIGLYLVHIFVHWLLIFPLLLHLSHCSNSSCFQSQHL
jgi:hypothetical protein